MSMQNTLSMRRRMYGRQPNERIFSHSFGLLSPRSVIATARIVEGMAIDKRLARLARGVIHLPDLLAGMATHATGTAHPRQTIESGRIRMGSARRNSGGFAFFAAHKDAGKPRAFQVRKPVSVQTCPCKPIKGDGIKGFVARCSRLISRGGLVPAFARMTLLVCGFPLSRE